jgi:Kef-type K+ transport system membrane component KefB
MGFIPAPGTTALLEIFVFLAAAEALRFRIAGLNVPPVIGDLILGMILAPVALGGVINGLLPFPLFEVNNILIAFSEFSVILLIFSAGLEGGLSSLRTAGGFAVLAAVAGNLIPFGITYIAFAGWYGSSAAMLLAVAAGATSTAVVVSLIRAEGLGGTRGGSFLLATCALDDVVGLIVLSAILSIVGGQLGAVAVTGRAAVTVVIWLALLVGSVFVVPRIFRLLGPRESYNLPFLILFVLAAIVTFVGFSAIVGAFIAGLAIAESFAAEQTRKMAEFLLAIFGSLFFVVVGFEFDGRLLADPRVLVAGLILTGIAAGGKVMGVLLPAHRRFRHPGDAAMIAVGMVPRGEIGLIVGAVGISTGLLTQAGLGAILVMALLTTSIGGYVFHRIAQGARQRYAREEAAEFTLKASEVVQRADGD